MSARWKSVTVATACALIVTSCSVGVEETPRPWSSWDEFEDPPQVTASGVQRIFLLERRPGDAQDVLVTVKRDIDEGINFNRAVLDVLFEGPTSAEAQQGLISTIPPGLTILDVRLDDQGTVLLNLSEQLTTALEDELVAALAQIVWTLCERPDVRQVQILVQDRQRSWPRADGTAIDRPLTPFDFPGYALSSQPDFPGIIGVSSPG